MAKRSKTKKSSRLSTLKMAEHKLGHLAFIAGVIVAIIAGLAASALDPQVVALVLVVLGVVVGFMNVNAKEVNSFLLAALALMIANVADVVIIPIIGPYIQTMLSNIGTFVAPAAIVVALKSVKKLAES